MTSDGVALVIGAGGVLARFTGVEHAAPGGDADGDGLADLAFVSDTSQMGFVFGPLQGEHVVDDALTAPIPPPTGFAVRTGSDGMRDLTGDGLADFMAMVVDLEYGDPALWDGTTLIPLPPLASNDGGLAMLDTDSVAFHDAYDAVAVLSVGSTLPTSFSRLPRSTRYVQPGVRALGDLDGDGDPDVAATVSQGERDGRADDVWRRGRAARRGQPGRRRRG